MTPTSALALALAVAAQTAPTTQTTNVPPWLLALGGLGTILGSVIVSWFTAKTKTEKLSALGQTINAVPTAWNEVLKARRKAGLPDVPNADLISQVLAGAAQFAERALTASEEKAAREAIIKAAPSPTALASAVAGILPDAKAKPGTVVATKI